MPKSSSLIPAWHERVALENADGCVVHMKELLEIWLRQTPKLLADAREGLTNSNAKLLHLAAHTMKGSLQILGADVASSIAELLETAGRDGKMADGLEFLIQLETELAVLTSQITIYLHTH